MDLASILTVDHIAADMKSRDHWPAVVELVDHLVQKNLLREDQRDDVLKSLEEREVQTSTGIGNGVAIPHAFSDELDHVVAAFGRSKKGIEFEALDNTPVKFIVLFVVPRSQYHLHLKTLAAIAKLFRSSEVLDALESAPSAEAILQIFSERVRTVRA